MIVQHLTTIQDRLKVSLGISDVQIVDKFKVDTYDFIDADRAILISWEGIDYGEPSESEQDYQEANFKFKTIILRRGAEYILSSAKLFNDVDLVKSALVNYEVTDSGADGIVIAKESKVSHKGDVKSIEIDFEFHVFITPYQLLPVASLPNPPAPEFVYTWDSSGITFDMTTITFDRTA